MVNDRFKLSDQEIEKLKKLLDTLVEKEIHKLESEISTSETTIKEVNIFKKSQ